MEKSVGTMAAIFAIVMILCLPGTSSSEEIKVVTEDFPPYNYKNPTTGKVEGLGTEIVRAILKEAGSETGIIVFPWARAYKMAQEEKNVMIYSMKRTAKRENLFKWVAKRFWTRCQKRCIGRAQ